jgi:hypothetical protein
MSKTTTDAAIVSLVGVVIWLVSVYFDTMDHLVEFMNWTILSSS